MPRDLLRSQRLRMVNHQGDALRLGMNFAASEVVHVLTGHPPLSPVNAVQPAAGPA